MNMHLFAVCSVCFIFEDSVGLIVGFLPLMRLPEYQVYEALDHLANFSILNNFNGLSVAVYQLLTA